MDKFNRELNGYNKQEVNDFLQTTIQQLEGMLKKATIQDQQLQQNQRMIQEQAQKLQEQTRMIQNLNDQLIHYKSIDTTLQKAIFQAEEVSSNMKRIAAQESNLILEDAKQNANRIVNDALLRAERIELQADTIERNMRIFKKKLRAIVEQQMAVVDEIEDLELK